MRGINYILIALIVPLAVLGLLLRYLAAPSSAPPPMAASVQPAPHGCVIFGGSLPPPCQSNPGWTSGNWQPPAGVSQLHVLVVGGGGGGGAAIMRGGGGSGGGSGGVVVQNVAITAGAVFNVQIGTPGQGGQHYLQPGDNGTASIFGNITAYGGGGAANRISAQPPGTAQQGSSGGGGGGGGSDQPGFAGGAGGNGGTGGGGGQDGAPGGAPANPEGGQPGGAGFAFPAWSFTLSYIAPGTDGDGGAAIGQDGTGCGGGGGGGGGGVLLGGAGTSPVASSGPSPPGGATACGNDTGLSGNGGAGYGAGGGGGGNFASGTPGGAGAPGVVYVEW